MERIEDASILVVDDEPVNVALVERILVVDGFTNVRTTTDPRQVQTLFEDAHPDLVLLDLMMPHLDGFEVMSRINRWKGAEEFLPVLVLTADVSEETRVRSLSHGATDFLTKPLDKVEVVLRIRNLLTTRLLTQEQALTNEILETKVRERTEDLHVARDRLIDVLGKTAEFRDYETGRHTHRVGVTASMMADRLGLDPDEVERIGRTAPLHDVGKIGIPDRILLKPGPLTAPEFEEMQKHTLIGATLLEGEEHLLISTARTIALSHHEDFDGSGYPHHLAGDQIPIASRIVSVADVWDALTHERPYKEAWPEERALAEIERNAGIKFDPAMVEVFLALHDQGLAEP